jgi:soluble cytochrome b562
MLGIGNYFLGGKGNKKVMDDLSKNTHTEQVILRDTLKVHDTLIAKAKNIYITKHDTLFKEAPKVVDAKFDSTFPRDSGDTSGYSHGFTQLRKAIDANDRATRDSIIVAERAAQVKACTTTVEKIVEKVDVAKKEIKPESSGMSLRTMLEIGFGVLGLGAILGVSL